MRAARGMGAPVLLRRRGEQTKPVDRPTTRRSVELPEHFFDPARIERRGGGHRGGAQRREIQFDRPAVGGAHRTPEIAQALQPLQRSGERRRRYSEMTRKVAGLDALLFIEMTEQHGIFRGKPMSRGTGANVVDVARQIDFGIAALNGSDLIAWHFPKDIGNRIVRQNERIPVMPPAG